MPAQYKSRPTRVRGSFDEGASLIWSQFTLLLRVRKYPRVYLYQGSQKPSSYKKDAGEGGKLEVECAGMSGLLWTKEEGHDCYGKASGGQEQDDNPEIPGNQLRDGQEGNEEGAQGNEELAEEEGPLQAQENGEGFCTSDRISLYIRK